MTCDNTNDGGIIQGCSSFSFEPCL